MTAYNTSPFTPSPVLMVGGKPEFLYGSLDDRSSGTQIAITSVAITSNVATVVGTIVSGKAPIVGNLVSLQSSNSTFNVTNVAIASVTSNLTTGVTTITFPLTNGNVTTTAATGFAAVPVTIVPETIAAGSSKPAASAENDPSTNDERSYMAQVFFGTVPTAATVTLQASLVDLDSAYQTVGTVAVVAGGVVSQNAATFSSMNYRFVRFNVSGLSGTGTIAAAILG